MTWFRRLWCAMFGHAGWTRVEHSEHGRAIMCTRCFKLVPAPHALEWWFGGGRIHEDPPFLGCFRAPSGWWCSREPGHDGPCAARRIR